MIETEGFAGNKMIGQIFQGTNQRSVKSFNVNTNQSNQIKVSKNIEIIL